MTIDEAIELLDDLRAIQLLLGYTSKAEALQLGIDALHTLKALAQGLEFTAKRIASETTGYEATD